MPSTNALPYRCDSNTCRENEKAGDIFYLEPNAPKVCPNCGIERPGLLTPLSIIHLQVPVDPKLKGDIPDLQHDWNFGCAASKAVGNHGKLMKMGHGLSKWIGAVTCQGCIQNYEAALNPPQTLKAPAPPSKS